MLSLPMTTVYVMCHFHCIRSCMYVVSSGSHIRVHASEISYIANVEKQFSFCGGYYDDASSSHSPCMCARQRYVICDEKLYFHVIFVVAFCPLKMAGAGPFFVPAQHELAAAATFLSVLPYTYVCSLFVAPLPFNAYSTANWCKRCM